MRAGIHARAPSSLLVWMFQRCGRWHFGSHLLRLCCYGSSHPFLPPHQLHKPELQWQSYLPEQSHLCCARGFSVAADVDLALISCASTAMGPAMFLCYLMQDSTLAGRQACWKQDLLRIRRYDARYFSVRVLTVGQDERML